LAVNRIQRFSPHDGPPMPDLCDHPTIHKGVHVVRDEIITRAESAF